MKSNSNKLLWTQTVGRNLHEDKVMETALRCISTYGVIRYSLVAELTWQWREVMERVFRGRAHQYEPFDCFKLSGRMTLDDFGRDLMRGTIGEQVVGELWTSWMNGFTFFLPQFCILHFVGYLHTMFATDNSHWSIVLFDAIASTAPPPVIQLVGWSVTYSNSRTAAIEYPSGAIGVTCDLWDTWSEWCGNMAWPKKTYLPTHLSTYLPPP